MKTNRTHYGKELIKFIANRGIKKMFISKSLNMSRPTLNARLVDGEFTDQQIIEIKKIIKR